MIPPLAATSSWSHRLVGLLVVFVALVGVVVLGFLPASGLRSKSPAPADFNSFYAAGQCYRLGLDPYNFDAYNSFYRQDEGRPSAAPCRHAPAGPD